MSKITVLMPVYNAATHLEIALFSVLNQSVGDFEFLIMDDASTDNSAAIINRYKDRRIRYMRNDQNLGVARTLNAGIELATGEYIVRMDADDESFPQRLKILIDFMDKTPRVGAAGSWVKLVGSYGGILRQPSGSACVRASLCLDNPLIHPTVIIRADILKRYGLRYDDTFSRSEDYDLWSRLSVCADIDNVPDVLLKYRVHRQSVTAIARNDMEDQSIQILRRELILIGLAPTDDELTFHRRVGHGMRLISKDEVRRAATWLCRIVEENRRTRYHDEAGMEQAVAFAWFRLCMHCGNLGPWIWKTWRKSMLSDGYQPSAKELASFAFSFVWNPVFRTRLCNSKDQFMKA